MTHRIDNIDERISIIKVNKEIEGGAIKTINSLRDTGAEQIREGKNIIIDFGDVNICPSVVWGNIIVQSKRAREKDLTIAVCELRPTLEKSVKIIGMPKYVTVCKGVEEAKKALSTEE